MMAMGPLYGVLVEDVAGSDPSRVYQIVAFSLGG